MSQNTVNVRNMPSAWQDADVLDGLELTPKDDLQGLTFRITGVQFRTNDNGVQIVDIDAERRDLSTFAFNDSSTGVKAQIIKYLTDTERGDRIDSGEYIEMNLIVPNGLRVSEFPVKDDRGREKMARTFYLTTSGRRPGYRSGDAARPERKRASAPAKTPQA